MPTSAGSGRRGTVMISDKIRPHNLERKAILYVRQSSAHQVLHNRESSALQYSVTPGFIYKTSKWITVGMPAVPRPLSCENGVSVRVCEPAEGVQGR